MFVEDLKPGLLKKYKSILVVGQTVALEPALKTALNDAAKTGTTIFYDGTCRPELVAEWKPLGVSFNQFEKDRSPASDDSALLRFPTYCKANVPALKKALDPVVVAPAQIDNPEVFVSERKVGDGRFLFVANNTTPELEPGHLWRITLAIANRVPVLTNVRLPDAPVAVYDVFAGKRITLDKGALSADLRSLPGRIYALLPSAIDRVELHADPKPREGRSMAWSVKVLSEDGKPIPTNVPVRLRLLDAENRVLDERFLSSPPNGTSGTTTIPLNPPAGSTDTESAFSSDYFDPLSIANVPRTVDSPVRSAGGR